jgi:hypothetical protein
VTLRNVQSDADAMYTKKLKIQTYFQVDLDSRELEVKNSRSRKVNDQRETTCIDRCKDVVDALVLKEAKAFCATIKK